MTRNWEAETQMAASAGLLPTVYYTEKPCSCWLGPVTGHFSHCCFRGGETEDYQYAQPAPCGHFVAEAMV